MVTLSQTIPALPVRDAAAAVDFYRDRLGFEVLHHDGGFAVHVPRRGGRSTCGRRATRAGASATPGPRRFCSGAESVHRGDGELPDRRRRGVDELFSEYAGRTDVLHPVSQ